MTSNTAKQQGAAVPAEAIPPTNIVWRMELLGGLRLYHQGRALEHFKTRRVAQLLARLACFPNRSHPRDMLAEELWPEEAPDTLRERFRQTLALLRRELEPSGIPAGSVLIADRSTVRLAPGSFSTDVADFETACRIAKSEHSTRQLELLQQAVGLYRGELLPGFYEDWIQTERGHLAERYRQALGLLTHGYAALRRFDEAIAAARQTITLDTLSEEAHRTLIRVFAQAGRVSDARRQYEELEHLLRQELDAEPTAETQNLMAQIRSGIQFVLPEANALIAATSSTVTPPASISAPKLAALAPQTLPIAPQIETISAPPTTVPPAAPPLPLSMTRFFGREEEIARLASLLPPVASPTPFPPPLVTLTGPGGAGKTRLALETARRLWEAYGGAVWFVPLADVAHPDLIADAIVDALALVRSVHAAPLEQAVEFLRPYPAALLILDNLEHLQEEGTPYVQLLRRRLPCLSCLVTSRHKLNVDGERDMALTPLRTPEVMEAPDALTSPEELLAYPSIQLFLDRAQAARYSFLLTHDNAGAVATLGQRLEGLPLAIELAAAWAATLTPEQILQRLSRRFDLLVSRRKDIPQRHQSLQAVLEGSYQLLPPTLQRLYARLSVFRGGWTLEAAEALSEEKGEREKGTAGTQSFSPLPFLLSPSNVLDGLAVLQERSFVISEERGTEMRYRFLESLREFGAEQLSVEEQFALSGFHAAYFLALTGEAQTRQRTPEEKQWFDRLEAETDNLRAALEWTTANDTKTALTICARLGGFWMTRGFAREGSEWLHKALSAAGKTLLEDGEIARTHADALNYLALMKLALGGYEEGQALARESLALLRGLKDEMGMARALNTLGAILMEQGHYHEAQTCYEECLRLYRGRGYHMGESIVLANLGNVVYARGEYALACAYYTECLETRRVLGDQRGIAAVLDYLGRAVREQGDYTRARDLHRESLAMRRELNDKQNIALSLNHLGTAQTYLGEREEARRLLEESVTLTEAIGDKAGQAEALSQLAELARLSGDEQAARAFWSQSLVILREAGDQSSIAATLEAFAGLARSEDQYYGAAQMLGAAEAIRRDISCPVRPSQRPRYEQTIATLHEILGKERFQQAWTEGQSLSLETALKLI